MKILKEVIIRYQTEGGRIVKAYEQGELIRCKDCKHWRIHISDAETCGERFEIDGSELITDADDFCSRAERKEE